MFLSLNSGSRIQLNQLDTRPPDTWDEKKEEKSNRSTLSEIRDLQQKLYAESKQALLVVMQGMDASGKDSTVRHVFGLLNPQGVNVSSFKQPETSELAHDFLWRIHYRVPAKGMIVVFNRSHYEDVLIVRVRHLKPELEWRKHFRHICDFENMLHDTGTRILKFYLHISPEEQEKRLKERISNPVKKWKYHEDDWKERAYWNDYQKAYEEVFHKTATAYAPWYIVPADHKRYRDQCIAETILKTLKEMKPEYPG